MPHDAGSFLYSHSQATLTLFPTVTHNSTQCSSLHHLHLFKSTAINKTPTPLFSLFGFSKTHSYIVFRFKFFLYFLVEVSAYPLLESSKEKEKKACTDSGFTGVKLNPIFVAMGKSPGRWIKTLIFGKKSSRSKANVEKRDVERVLVSPDQRTEIKTEQNIQPDNSQDDVCISAMSELNAQNESDRIREEQAAIDLQAALRGCLARRSFQTLKGIIRLQALIRGHLVRRQAISTLYCMFQIIKFQALVRGRRIRSSNVGVQVGKRCNLKIMCSVGVSTSMQIVKLSSNGFAQKILASFPTPLPLHFHYDSNEANSVLSWLERWSTSRCWQLLPRQKSSHQFKPKKPHTRRSSVTNVEIMASEFDKPIRSVRKVNSSQESENCVEENPELVLERIKRNLRKVSSSVLNSTNDSVQHMISEPEKLGVNEAETMIIKKNEKEDENVKERKKYRRVVCATVKQEFIENNEPPQIKQSVPGYMAATVSAKAKLRAQDGPENYNSLTRRYSMCSLTDASIPTSPMAKTRGKLKNDRSPQLSGDGNVKVNQPEWRR